MKSKAAILNLGARFGIESPHTTHVAGLALELFDGFYPLNGLSKQTRKLLYTAACLHDIAYAADPENHVMEGARILAENPIAGFTSDEWLAVIGIVLLHKRDWRAMLEYDLFPKVGEKQVLRIKKLAAILRIADGLDHGHIQDARILQCRRGRKTDRVRVECSWYAGNIPWAEGKADLWEAVFKQNFRIEGRLKRHKKPFTGIVGKKDPAIMAARRLLYSQWSTMRDKVPGMLDGSDLEYLHDYRVAMRRFRAVLRMFKPLLGETSAQDMDQRLDELSGRMSSVRDAHVSLQFIRSLESAERQYPELIQSLQSEVLEANQILRSILESDFCLQTVQAASRFLRTELPALERRRIEPLLPEFAQGRLDPLLERILGQDVTGLREADPVRLHAFRKLCRRARYCSEFVAPVLDKRIRHAAKHLKTIAGALGDIRDGRALLRQFNQSEIATLLVQREDEAWAGFQQAWRKLTSG